MIQHPAIDIVDQFTDAFVKGDTLTMHNLTTEDFRWWQMNNATTAYGFK